MNVFRRNGTVQGKKWLFLFTSLGNTSKILTKAMGRKALLILTHTYQDGSFLYLHLRKTSLRITMCMLPKHQGHNSINAHMPRTDGRHISGGS